MKTKLFTCLLFLSASIAGAKQVDLSKSSFIWKGSKIVGDFHSGPIKMKKASLSDGKGEFVADMSTIDDTTLNGDLKGKFLSHIKSEDFFDVSKYPTASLKIEKMEKGKLHGKLTVKGKTNSVVVPYEKKGNTYTGELKFDRTKYDVIYGSGKFFKNLGDKVIADDISLKFKVVTK